MELLIIDEDLINALGYKMYIERLISLLHLSEYFMFKDSFHILQAFSINFIICDKFCYFNKTQYSIVVKEPLRVTYS